MPSTQVERLIQLYEEIRPVLIQCGLCKSAIAYKRESIDDAPEKQLEMGIKFLEAFKAVRIADYKRARAEVSEEQWERYEAIGVEGLWEQENLAEKRENLIADWRSRPNILRKIKDKKLDAPRHKVKKGK